MSKDFKLNLTKAELELVCNGLISEKDYYKSELYKERSEEDEKLSICDISKYLDNIMICNDLINTCQQMRR